MQYFSHILHEKSVIEKYLRENAGLNVYCLGDLDDFFWNRTVWYGLSHNAADGPRALAMLYTGGDISALMAYREYEGEHLTELIGRISHLLPARFYAHLCGPSQAALSIGFDLEPFGRHYKMLLTDTAQIAGGCPPAGCGSGEAVRLGYLQLEALTRLYSDSYPGNWFDPAMLATGEYFGIYEGDRLVCAAGVHVFSKRYGAAALGNITTLPSHRGRGLASAVTAALCSSLLEKTRHIGLNVDASNAPAIKCYEKLGFEIVGEYGEFTARVKRR